MLDPLYMEAWVHAPAGHTVLGRRLHPFCALDLVALDCVQSPFMRQGSLCTVTQLLQAIWILSNPHAEDCTIEHIDSSPASQEWVRTLEGKVDLVRDCAAIENYIKDYYSLPELISQPEASPMDLLGAPWMLSSVIKVCRALHVPLREAWTMGIGQLLWYRAAVEEIDDANSRIIGPLLRAEMDRSAAAAKVFKMNPGETLADFAARAGLAEEDAAILLHNQST